jgi:hypothetical protein
MKSLFLGMIFLVACAGEQRHYTNVAHVRQDIRASIAQSGPTRDIVSMGHTTDDSAVVYTQTGKGAPTVEEAWVKDGAGWKMKGATDSKSQATN